MHYFSIDPYPWEVPVICRNPRDFARRFEEERTRRVKVDAGLVSSLTSAYHRALQPSCVGSPTSLLFWETKILSWLIPIP